MKTLSARQANSTTLLLAIFLLTSCETTQFTNDVRAFTTEAGEKTIQFFDGIRENVSNALETNANEAVDAAPDEEKPRIEVVVATNRGATQTGISHDFESVVSTSKYRGLPFDNRARNLPSEIARGIYKDPERHLPVLARYFADLEDDPFIRAKLIHDWIADNIAYDTVAFYSGNVVHRSVFDTVRSRKAVCQGYAELYEFMARDAGIHAEVITGYARGAGYSPLEPEAFYDSNHAWNAVHIDGAWYLLDCTWNAGAADGRVFRKSYSTGYLFLEPERMIYTHFPENEVWQLLESPRTADEINQKPSYRGDWFLYGLPLLEGVGKVNTADGLSIMRIETPPDIDLSCRLITAPGSDVTGASFSQRTGDMTELIIGAPAEGDYLLRIFAKQHSESRSEMVLQLGITAENTVPASLPTVYSPFIEDRCYLVSPLGEPIEPGDIVFFEIDLPGYLQAFLADGKSRLQLTKGEANDRFAAEIVVPPCRNLTLYASKNESGSFSGILQFSVGDI